MTISYLKLPSSTNPNISYTSPLDGVDYKFTFQYSTRNDCWYLTLSNTSDEILISNIRLAPHILLTNCFVDERLPIGNLILVSDSAYESPPTITLENLSTDFTFVYDDGQ